VEEKQGTGGRDRSRNREQKKKKGQTNVERDLIIGQACTLTNFRERVVKGAEKPESRRTRGGRRGNVGRKGA